MTQTILLVEDDPEVGLVIRDLLFAVGYGVVLVTSASAALAALAAGAAAIHLVLSDIRLNSHSGRWLCAQLRVLYPSLPFVLMSGYRNNDSECRIEVTFIAKPFAIRDLVATFGIAGLPQESPHA